MKTATAALSALILALICSTAFALGKKSAPPAAPAGPAQAVFTASSAAPLGATKRAAITQVIVTFQTSTGQTVSTASYAKDFVASGGNAFAGLLRRQKTTETAYMRLNLDNQTATAVADAVYQKLQSDLAAAGFEVVPESEVLGNPNYQAIVKEAGYTNPSRYFNVDGDSLLAGPSGLKPYMPYAIETGNYYENRKTYIPGWVKMMGNSSTEGGPKSTLANSVWKLPDMEARLATELNAHLVKANYVVTLGTIELSASHSFDSTTNAMGETVLSVADTVERNATAALGLRESQSRIAFRVPGGKSQKAVKGSPYQAPKDGDVVVTIDHAVAGPENLYKTHPGSERMETVADINDGTAFTDAAADLIGGEQKKMLALIRP